MSRITSSLGTGTTVAMEKAAAGIIAALFGIFILYGVGFAHITHDTAHDTRHSTGFPCH